MKKITLFFILAGLVGLGQAPAQQQTADGGHIIIGYGSSFTTGKDDILVYKLDANGAKQWRKNYGGSGWEYGPFIEQTPDGGYVLIGTSGSYVHGTPGDDTDLLVYKLDAAGAKQWRRNYGGAEYDYSYAVHRTADGGYILSGETESYVHGSPGDDDDFLVYKTDAAGNKQWRKNYGGIYDDHGREIVQTADGGYAIIGDTDTYSNGEDDFLVYRLDAAGNKLWRKNYGGIDDEYGYSLVQTADGGFLLLGYTYTYTHGLSDVLVYKVDAAGAKQWRKSYGGSDYDYCYGLAQAADGGYVLCGHTHTYTHTPGYTDFLVYKIDAAGNKLWRKNYGGVYSDYGYYVWPTTDGGYMLLGESRSYSHNPGKDTDLLLYKVDAAGAKLWRKNYGGTEDEYTGRGGK